MFNLKKIITSGVNVPEPELIAAEGGYQLSAGAALVFQENRLIIGAQDQKPTHITLQDMDEEDYTVLCYRITPNMLFEVEVIGKNVAGITNGSKLCLYNTEYGYTALSDETENGVAIVYDRNNAKKSGDTVYVTFD